MAKRSVRAYVELASGLGEMTRARAVEAAQELVTLAGSKGSSTKVAKQVEKLAGDLLSAAEQNRAQVVGLVQREVETAVSRVDVSRLLGEVQSLGATVAGLAAQVDELARSVGGRAARAPRAGLAEVAEPVLGDPPATMAATPPRSTPARKAPARKAPARKAPPQKAAAAKTAAKKAPAKKAPAKKSATKTSAARKSSATKAPTTSAAKKSTAKKSTAKKSTAKKSTATKTPAKKSVAKKTTKKAGA
ncbi:hypothetical protein [Phycicoccus sonneratiae]|uniref:Uncharacterized protein n=1 Tax=Phycicoccus sonneratiae TaxID=2807628 RepID=A0ABS2CIT9_9MICO|nr:hypothetical protein [Phycicoccus sonneraticus]MBM6399388.1 hypothetical protein [Phycicoccus sonneraticus]